MEKAYLAAKPKTTEAPDPGIVLRDKGEVASRSCYGEKAKGSAAFKAATHQAAAIVAALMAARME